MLVQLYAVSGLNF